RTKDEARRKLRSFLDAGVNFFLDLTEEDEGLEPYAPLLQEEAVARERKVVHRRLPITDLDVPTTDRMQEIQRTIAAALEAGRTGGLCALVGRRRPHGDGPRLLPGRAGGERRRSAH